MQTTGYYHASESVPGRIRTERPPRPRKKRSAIALVSTSSSSRWRSRFGTNLNGVFASGVYAGSGSFTATLTSNGAPVAGQTIAFELLGRAVGSATTNAQGVATLPNVSLAGVNAGVYANQVTASFAGNTSYRQNAASGTSSVSKAQATVNLGGLNQTYNAKAKSVSVTTNPPDRPPASRTRTQTAWRWRVPRPPPATT